MNSYTVKAGDTLSSIALMLYGDASQYTAIVAANPSITNADAIYAGQVLNIPDLSQVPAPAAAQDTSSVSTDSGSVTVSDSSDGGAQNVAVAPSTPQVSQQLSTPAKLVLLLAALGGGFYVANYLWSRSRG